ncbi:hypothetical protein KFZ56_04145 [Virgibacillus sp. NKC19-3]|uniref:hypothetical protein n=1 Tax=Virgibacillus saliphilus TaxID=2831674 RepID=UPI001C9A6182|nr:hypothetical protein [Virgibacillus sp. NKC19-3]MBY7142296.1 hypothetical protein [Virgibacillus sp. NKC19-3]
MMIERTKNHNGVKKVYNYCINQLVDIPEVRINNAYLDEKKNLILVGKPILQMQPCPVYSCERLKRNETPYYRHVRHLSIVICHTYVQVPTIFLQCKSCGADFV